MDHIILLVSGPLLALLSYQAWKGSSKSNRWLVYVLLLVLLATYLALPRLSHYLQLTIGALIENPMNWKKHFLLLHIVLAIPCVLFGPVLLFEPFRRKSFKWHRWMGKVYVATVLLSALIAFPLSLLNNGVLAGRIGFSTMAVLWFGFTLKGFLDARNRKIASHRRWMLRSYAMTFAFVHVNVTYRMLDVYGWVQHDPLMVKILQSYVSWMANLLLVELFLRWSKRRKKPRRA